MRNLLSFIGLDKKKLDAELLRNFVNQIYNGESLTYPKAKQNVKEGLIEIIYPDGSHSSSGLLITKSGYFVTANHCLNKDKRKIRTSSGKIYNIKKVCAFSKKYDVVLAKSNISKERSIFDYKLSLKIPEKDSILVSISKENEKLNYISGFVKDVPSAILHENYSYNSKDFFGTSLKSKFGDSGSVICDFEGRLFGVLSSSNSSNSNPITLGVNFFNVLELIETYRASLEE